MSDKGPAAKLTRFWPRIRPNDVSRFRSANYKPRNSEKQLILAESVLKVFFMRTTVPVSLTTFHLLLHHLGWLILAVERQLCHGLSGPRVTVYLGSMERLTTGSSSGWYWIKLL
jgi:hypothetical protein